MGLFKKRGNEHMHDVRILLVSHNFLGFRCLKKMVEKGFTVVGVIGRIKKETQVISDYCDEFEDFCSINNVQFFKFSNINEPGAVDAIRSLKPDAILVLGWSQIIKDELFSIPKLGIFGSHPSLLPKNRGNAAIPWQIINNEKESGLTLFKFEPAKPVDSGDIYAQKRFQLNPGETAKTFYEKVLLAAERIIEDDLEGILTGRTKGVAQDESIATYLTRRRPEDGIIDWNQDVQYLERVIRAIGDPYPGAFTFYKNKRINIIRAKVADPKVNRAGNGAILASDEKGVLVQCGVGTLIITEISDETGESMAFRMFRPGGTFDAIASV